MCVLRVSYGSTTLHYIRVIYLEWLKCKTAKPLLHGVQNMFQDMAQLLDYGPCRVQTPKAVANMTYQKYMYMLTRTNI